MRQISFRWLWASSTRRATSTTRSSARTSFRGSRASSTSSTRRREEEDHYTTAALIHSEFDEEQCKYNMLDKPNSMMQEGFENQSCEEEAEKDEDKELAKIRDAMSELKLMMQEHIGSMEAKFDQVWLESALPAFRPEL